MSLILDALRKSEAERRRGQVPDLHAERAPGVQPARDGPPPWLWMTLVLATAVVLALALWLARSMMAVPSGAAGEEPGARAYIGTTAESPVPPTPVDTPAPIIEPDTAAAMATSESPAAAPEPLAGTEPVSAPRQAAADDTASSGTAKSEQSPIASRADAAAVDRAVPAQPVTAARAEEIPQSIATAPAPAPAPVPAEPTRMPPAPGTTTIAQQEPMPLSDLSVAEREQLPPLRMSMHLWAPTQRFAIIDGARVSEGDRVGDAVVEAVTADGVVLAWQGYRLQIPVR